MGFGSSSSGQNKHIRIIIFRTCLHKSSIKICNRNILEREKIWKMNEPNGWCFQHVLERFGSLQHGARRSASAVRCDVGGEPTQHNKSPTDFPVRWAEIRRKEVGKDAKYLFACLCTLIWSRLGSRENYTVNNCFHPLRFQNDWFYSWRWMRMGNGSFEIGELSDWNFYFVKCGKTDFPFFFRLSHSGVFHFIFIFMAFTYNFEC